VGLEADVRLELWLSEEYRVNHPDSGRYVIQPSNVDEWFRNYRKVCMNLAEILESEGAKRFCIGVELFSMEQFAQQWRDLADSLRTCFSGEIVFAELTSFLIQEEVAFGGEPFSNQAGTFWDALDAIGMNSWPGYRRHTDYGWASNEDQRFSEVVENFTAFWSVAATHYSESFPNQRQYFTEIGNHNYDGSAAWLGFEVQDNPSLYQLDNQEDADLWATYLIAARLLGIQSLAVWMVPLGFTVQHSQIVGGNAISGLPSERVFLSLTGKPVMETLAQVQGQVYSGEEVDSALARIPPCLEWSQGIQPTYQHGGAGVPSASQRGAPGFSVEFLRAGVSGSTVILQVKLHSGDQLGEFVYSVDLIGPENKIQMNLSPYLQRCDVVVVEESQWRTLCVNFEIQVLEDEIRMIIPLDCLMQAGSIQSLLQRELSLKLRYVRDNRHELYYFPGVGHIFDAASPAEREATSGFSPTPPYTETGLSIIQENVVISMEFPSDVQPTEHSIGGVAQTSTTSGNWGLAGCDVRSVVVAQDGEDLLIQWSLDSSPSDSHYSYCLGFWHPSGQVFVLSVANPVSLQAGATHRENEVWRGVANSRVTVDELGCTITYRMRDVQFPSGYSTSDLAGWLAYASLIYGHETQSSEWFELPSEDVHVNTSVIRGRVEYSPPPPYEDTARFIFTSDEDNICISAEGSTVIDALSQGGIEISLRPWGGSDPHRLRYLLVGTEAGWSLYCENLITRARTLVRELEVQAGEKIQICLPRIDILAAGTRPDIRIQVQCTKGGETLPIWYVPNLST